MRANKKLPKGTAQVIAEEHDANMRSERKAARIGAPTKAPIPPALRTERPFTGTRPIGVTVPVPEKTRKIAQILELLAFPFIHGPTSYAGIFLCALCGTAVGFALSHYLFFTLGFRF